MYKVRNMEEATGYIYTHADCPDCGMEEMLEGDAMGEEVECEHCKCKFVITRT